MSKKTRKELQRKYYMTPECAEINLGSLPLLSNSITPRDDYGDGGDPFSQGDMSGRDDYSGSGDPFSQGDMSGRDNYNDGGDPFSQGGGAKAFTGDWGTCWNFSY